MGHVRKHAHVSGRDYTFEQIQDVEPILEHNKTLTSLEQKSDWGRHKAKVPMVVINKWLNEEYARGNKMRFIGPGFAEWLNKKLDDPDNRAWRVDNPSNPFYIGWKEKCR